MNASAAHNTLTDEEWSELGKLKIAKKEITVEARRSGMPLYRMPNEYYNDVEDAEEGGAPRFIELISVNSLFSICKEKKAKLKVTNVPLFTHRVVIMGMQNLNQNSDIIWLDPRDRHKMLEEIEKQAAERMPALSKNDLKHFEPALEAARTFCQRK